MTARRTQAERRAATRNAILRAAAARFLEQGIATTSLDEIASEAGVTKGALYHYFASKDELVAAVAGALGTLDAAEEAPGRRPGGAELGRMSGHRAPPLLERALNYELYALSARQPELRTALGARVRAAIEALAEEHRASPRDVVVAGALHEGLWIHRLLNPDLVTDELFVEAFSLLDHLPRVEGEPRDADE